MRHKEADARLRNGHYLVFMHYSLYSHALYETHKLIILCAIFLSRARIKPSNMHPSNKEHLLGENEPKKRVRVGKSCGKGLQYPVFLKLEGQQK